jgi:hypothetical protein
MHSWKLLKNRYWNENRNQQEIFQFKQLQVIAFEKSTKITLFLHEGLKKISILHQQILV